MEVVTAGSVLSNSTRVNLLKLLAEGPLSATEAHEAYVDRYDSKHRESIYRELENLVEDGFVDKNYSEARRSLLYHLRVSELHFDITEGTVETTQYNK